MSVAILKLIRTYSTHRQSVNVMTSHQVKVQKGTYFRVMPILQDEADLTQRELTAKLRVSIEVMNFCLKAIILKGWVMVQKFSHGENKFGYVYMLTPEGVFETATLASSYLLRKL
jgi:EPS-associated MarR family transcriptional regulator